MPSREDEIRARLEAATPGPWETDVDYPYRQKGILHFKSVGAAIWWGSIPSANQEMKSNAEFIANAPTDIAYLLDELRKQRGYEETHIANLDLLRAENQRLRERLGEAERLMRGFLISPPDNTFHIGAFDDFPKAGEA